MDFEIRPVTAEELPAFIRWVGRAFGGHPSEDEVAGWAQLTELDRTLAAFEDGAIVANAGADSLELTLPGATVTPAAGIIAVGVRPTHRRRGLLRMIMERQLDDVASGSEPLAILTASESAIYGRFGYGAATYEVSVALETAHSDFSPPVEDPGSVQLLEPDEARALLPPVHDRARRQQTADINRRSEWWDLFCHEPDWKREGGAPKAFFAVHRSAAGEADGWVTYRVKRSGSEGLPASRLEVLDLAATDPVAEAALWRYVLDIDLVREVTARSRPTDELLRHLLADPRRLRTSTFRDDLWVRLVDVAKALGARRYRVEGELVLEVVDAFRPQTSGRYALGGGPVDAECTRTRRRPDLTLDVAALGSGYLGNPRFGLLQRAGRVVEHRPGALRLADVMFGSDDVPFCRTAF